MRLLRKASPDEYNFIISNFGEVSHENIDQLYTKFTHGILDVYDHCLSYDDADKLLSSFIDHNLKYESRFLSFFETVSNENPIYINFDFSSLESSTILHILEVLDYEDKLLFIDEIRNCENSCFMFKVDDPKLLKLMVRLSTRELLFIIYYFAEDPAFVLGNFELSFPIFFLNSAALDKYKIIAKDNQLYIRCKLE